MLHTDSRAGLQILQQLQFSDNVGLVTAILASLLSLYISMFICGSIYLSNNLSIYPSTYLSLCLSANHHFDSCIIQLLSRIFIHTYIYLFAHSFIHLPIFPLTHAHILNTHLP